MYNKYIEAGRYDKIPASECIGILSSIIKLASTSDDKAYVEDSLLRLEALRHRLAS